MPAKGGMNMKRAIAALCLAALWIAAASFAEAGTADVVRILKRIEAMGKVGATQAEFRREALDLQLAVDEFQQSKDAQKYPDFAKKLGNCMLLTSSSTDSPSGRVLMPSAFKVCGEALSIAPKVK